MLGLKLDLLGETSCPSTISYLDSVLTPSPDSGILVYARQSAGLLHPGHFQNEKRVSHGPLSKVVRSTILGTFF